MSRQSAGIQTLVRKKAPYIIWTHCTICRQALRFRNMREVHRVDDCVKNSPLGGRLFGKLHYDLKAENKVEIVTFLSDSKQ
jgi:hypothetical protein